MPEKAQFRTAHFWLVVGLIVVFVLKQNPKVPLGWQPWIDSVNLLLTLLAYQLGVKWSPPARALVARG